MQQQQTDPKTVNVEIGVSPDRLRVTVAQFVDGKLISRMEMTAEQCDQHLQMLQTYRDMLSDKLPPLIERLTRVN